MTQLHAQAPGKLFLLGEYAVLDGAPAIIAAVDRYVHVRLSATSAAGGGRIHMSSDQTNEVVDFPAGEVAPQVPFYTLALSAYRVCCEAWPVLAHSALRIRIESQPSYAAQGKIGFGSSAAVCVALVAVLMATANAGSIQKERVFALALEAHRAAQGGVGSGGDVAASTFGGLIKLVPRGLDIPLVEALPVPADLHLLAAWTGTSASSPELIRLYQALANGHASVRRDFVAACTLAVEHFAAAAAGDRVGQPSQAGQTDFAAVAAAAAAIDKLASLTQLPILTPDLRRLIAISQEHGGVAKVSGAGGGDCGIAFARDSAAAASIPAAWKAAGLTPLPIAISQHGVSVEPA